MAERFEFIEPLVRIGLDLYAQDRDGNPHYHYFPRWDTNVNATHELRRSLGIYDEVVYGLTRWESTCMMQSCNVFDFFLRHFSPSFYQWPLAQRIPLLGFAVSILDPNSLGRIFHPDGRFRLQDLRRVIFPTGKTVLKRLLDLYFMERANVMRIRTGPKLKCTCKQVCTAGFAEHHQDFYAKPPTTFAVMGHQWWQIRGVVRQAVATASYHDLWVTQIDTGRTPLLEAMPSCRSWMRQWWNMKSVYGPRPYRLWSFEIQETVRDWLKDLQAAGMDLEDYGKMEAMAFITHRHCHRVRWPHGSKSAGYFWRGFKLGPRPEDWTLHWEWDPDVEGFVGDFWASIEDPRLTLPGSWVEDDGDSSDSESGDDAYHDPTGYHSFMPSLCSTDYSRYRSGVLEGATAVVVVDGMPQTVQLSLE